MTDALLVAEVGPENPGYRFSWGLAFAGGVVAAVVTFVLLSLGAGFGLLLGGTPSLSPAFLTGGGLYFLVATAFGFAVGGHIAGRLMGPVAEDQRQEDFRAGTQGFVAWAVAVLVTLAIITLAGLTAATSGAATAALYGTSSSKTHLAESSSYFLDKLFRPASPKRLSPADVMVDAAERAEAGRLLEASVMQAKPMAADDRDRLTQLVAHQTGLSWDAAAERVDAFQKAVIAEAKSASTAARKAASFASLWLAFAMIFGAVISMVSAIFARIEDDKDRAGAARYK